MGELDYIDDGFKKRLGYYSQKPSDKLWDSIENDLDKKSKKRYLVIISRIAAVLVIAAGIFGLYRYLNSDITTPQMAVKETKIEITPLNKSMQQQAPPSNASSNEGSNLTASSNSLYRNNNNANSKAINKDKNITTTNHQLAVIDDKNIDNTAPGRIQYSLLAFSEYQAIPVDISEDKLNVSEKDSEQGLDEDLVLQALADMYKEEPSRVYSLGGAAGPQYSNVFSNISSQSVSDIESGVMAYAGGINMQVATNKRWSIQSGVYYARTGFNSRPTASTHPETLPLEKLIENTITNDVTSKLFVEESDFTSHRDAAHSLNEVNSFENTANYSMPNTQREVEVEQLVEYFEIPLHFRYKLVDRKIDFQLLCGIGANYQINESIKTDADVVFLSNGQTVSSTSNEINFNSSLGFGLEYPLATDFVFSLEPVFKYYLKPEDRVYGNSVNPYSFGLMTGVRYKF
ncbi:MAG: outer membrane beta-barrel protein [Bacteroidales bacterium]|nr:outer membrane beta-barrel protein [Bacteroidales bacterium]